MHTAEHILNQTMVRMFKCDRSFSAHIEKKKSKVDYHFDRDLSVNELGEIQKKVNEVIQANHPISEYFIPRTDAERQFNLSKLPDSADDPLRIIKIGDYDACPCIGHHVHTTQEIGEFLIISSSYDNGILRLRFKLIEPE